MSVKIGHASIDENRRINGGNAGDQTTKEVCTITWYSHPWTSVIRPKDSIVAEKIAKAMEQACANENIGYDQYQRTTLYTQAKAKNWDLSKITSACECDCSSLVAVCVNAAGISVSKDIYTGNQKSALQSTGMFDVYTESKYIVDHNYLKRGDILLGDGHTAIVLSDGLKKEMRDMSNSSLVNYTKLSPNCTKMTNKVNRKITIHHAACNASIEALGAGFALSNRGASSNYGIGSDGRIGLYVNESDRSWCSSNYQNDQQAVTIEVANDKIGGDWHVSDKALASLINLCVDICKRNGIKRLNFTGDASGNLTQHNYFAATACPGPYLKSKFPYIASEVNKRLGVVDEPNNNTTTTKKDNLSVGGVMKLTPGAKYITGKDVPDWLYNMKLYVREINGDNIVFSIYKTGAITGTVSRKYIVNGGYNESTPNKTEQSKPTTNTSTSKFAIGDEVKLVSGATYYNGKAMPSFLFNMTLYVRGISGDNITISTLKTGAITGVVNKKYLKMLKSTSTTNTTTTENKPSSSSTLNVGDKVKLTSGATYHDGKEMPSWLFNMTLYVRGISGENITISTLKTGAITGMVKKKYLKKC